MHAAHGSYSLHSPSGRVDLRTPQDAFPTSLYKIGSVTSPLMTCFLVEDSPVIRQNLIATLEEMLAMKVIGTADDELGAKAWMTSADHRCDLMIIDIFLKSGTGLAVLEAARRWSSTTKLVVLSNYATSDMRHRCTALGADRVFDKSSELEDLLAYCEELAAH